MNNKEKYINFIVDDLVKKITFDEWGNVITPFEMDGRAITSSNNFTIHHNFLYEFREYVVGRYGTIKEESDTVWNQYRNRVRVYSNLTNTYTLIKK